MDCRFNAWVVTAIVAVAAQAGFVERPGAAAAFSQVAAPPAPAAAANPADVALDRVLPIDPAVRTEHRAYRHGLVEPADLVVIPLSFDGDRRQVYARPPARAVLVHDWIWRRTAPGAVVSWWLLKRINLVLQ